MMDPNPCLKGPTMMIWCLEPGGKNLTLRNLYNYTEILKTPILTFRNGYSNNYRFLINLKLFITLFSKGGIK